MCLAKIAITTILGSFKDERRFSSLKFIKSKLRSWLEGNLDTIVRVFSQGYYDLESFLYAESQMLTSIGEQPRSGRVCTSETILSP
jgi:hypothetical protein